MSTMKPLEQPPPKARAVADALRDLVHEQRLVPGDKLPSEADLIEMLAVGRSSVREGVQLLESLGIVTVVQGRGTFLSLAPFSALGQVLDWAYPNSARARLLDNLVEARLLIEPTQARLAAERATDAELEDLISRYGDEHESRAPRGLSVTATEEFGQGYHDFIARLAHNDVLQIMSNAIRPLYRSLVRELDRPIDAMEGIVEDHGRITTAIVARDTITAEKAMIEHIADVSETIRQWLDAATQSSDRRDSGEVRQRTPTKKTKSSQAPKPKGRAPSPKP